MHLGLRPGKLRALSKKKHAGLQGGDAEAADFSVAISSSAIWQKYSVQRALARPFIRLRRSWTFISQAVNISLRMAVGEAVGRDDSIDPR